MPITNFERYEGINDISLWCVISDDDSDKQIIEYFKTERSALNWIKKNKLDITKLSIFNEND